MAKSLVVVESPAKAKTINKYLGKNYKVVASMGHVRDLPKSKLGVAIEDGFEPSYEIIASRKKVMTELKAAAKEATEIFVATDPDREGEAIGWHLAEELGAGNRKKIRRLMFNEITKKGVLAALENPTKINRQMVDAQQARRVLDRLVGYKISPILWDKVRRGLSAGRVQSVALKIVVDREREISAFVPEEYWNLTARLAGPVPPEFDAKLLKKDGANIKIGNEAESNAVLDDLKQAEWTVASVTTKERKKGAVPPFITSKLQQASRFPVKKTMMIAQQLYEGIELPGEGAVGLITYMRTDSTRVAEQALTDVREFIGQKFGPDYVPEKPIYYKTKADAQDAHEAIRPTTMQYDPDAVRAQLTPDQYYLYRLIWNRFVASQMPAGDFRRNHRRCRSGEVPLPRQGIGAEVRRLDGGLQPGARRGTHGRSGPRRGERGRRRWRERAAGAERRRPARAEGTQARAEVHPAAAPLQRSHARQGARRKRDRPAEHLRVDHRRHPDARVRQQDRRPVQADAPRHDARREAPQPGVRRHPRRQLHARARGRARQDRGRLQRLRDRALQLLQEVRERLEARRQGHDQPQGGRRARSEGGVRQVRLADGDQGRQVRPVPGLQRLS